MATPVILGKYIVTLRFGEEYPKSVTDEIKMLWGKPWVDPSRGWNIPHSVAFEFSPDPAGSTMEVCTPVPVHVEKIWTRASDGAKVVTCKVNMTNQYQNYLLEFWHLGMILCKEGDWLDFSAPIGWVGGSYGWTGAGTGPHSAMTLKDLNGNYVDPEPLNAIWPQPAPTHTPTPPTPQVDPCLAIKGQLSEANTKITELNSRLQGILDQNAIYANALKTDEDNLSAYRQQVSGLNDTIETLTKKIVGLQDQITNLQDQLNTNDADVKLGRAVRMVWIGIGNAIKERFGKSGR